MDDRAVRQAIRQAGDFVKRQQAAGRGVRIREDYATDLVCIARKVIIDADCEVLVEGNGFEIDAIQPAIHRVKAVGDVREQ